MNIGVHRFFWIGVSGFLGYNPSSRIAGPKVSSIFSYLKKKHPSCSAHLLGAPVPCCHSNVRLELSPPWSLMAYWGGSPTTEWDWRTPCRQDGATLVWGLKKSRSCIQGPELEDHFSGELQRLGQEEWGLALETGSVSLQLHLKEMVTVFPVPRA